MTLCRKRRTTRTRDSDSSPFIDAKRLLSHRRVRLSHQPSFRNLIYHIHIAPFCHFRRGYITSLSPGRVRERHTFPPSLLPFTKLSTPQITLLILSLMIQRVQTLWLILAAVLMVITAFLPVARLIPDDIDQSLIIYNGVITGGACRLSALVLLFPSLLSLAFLADVYCIFKFADRKKQLRLCSSVMLILFLWYVSYFSLLHIFAAGDMQVSYSLNALIPFLAMVCVFLAKRRIRYDDELIRSVDRIR